MVAMTLRRTVAGFLVVVCLLSGCAAQQFFPGKCAGLCTSFTDFQPNLPTTPPSTSERPAQWGIVMLNQIKANLGTTSPPGVGRVLAIASTCMYEAITLFNDNLEPFVVKELIKVGLDSPDLVDYAIDGAAVKALTTIFGGSGSVGQVGDFLRTLDPEGADGFLASVQGDGSADFGGLDFGVLTKALARQAGSIVCQRVINRYTADGYDGLGNPVGRIDPLFFPVNDAQTRAGVTDCDAEMNDLDRWQPLCIPNISAVDGNVGTTDCVPQGWLGPTAGKWTTFAIPEGGAFDGKSLIDSIIGTSPIVQGGPPRFGVGTGWEDQAREVIKASADLDDALKLVAELWADGPDSTAPPGTWYLIAINAIQSRALDTVEASKLLMMMGNAVFDAGVAAWRIKLTFDSIRPLQMIQCGSAGRAGEDVMSWKGPYMGVGPTPAATWQPFQLDVFKTPPFGGYVSGHSTFSAAAAEVLRLFFGGDAYIGPRCTAIAEGASTFERKIGPGEPGFIAGVTDVPNTGKNTVGYSPRSQVTLCWETFTEAELQASESRIYGGIHVRADADDGVALGRQIGKAVFVKANKLFRSSADGVTSVF